MKILLTALATLGAVSLVLAIKPVTGAAGRVWGASVAANVVASSPTTGGGYPVPAGSRVPVAGTCGGPVQRESLRVVARGQARNRGPGRLGEVLLRRVLDVLHVLSRRDPDPERTPTGNNQVQGYDCISTGTQEMPPSWTDTTDPNVDFDTHGRVYQTTLPFNSFFDKTKLHPDGEIDLSYSDDLGRTWVKGNGGEPLEPPNAASAKQAGHVRTSSGWRSTTSPATGSRITSTRHGPCSTGPRPAAGSKCGWQSPRPRQYVRRARHDHAAVRSRRRGHLRVSGDRRGRERVRLGRLVPAERHELDDLRRALD